MVIDGEVQIVGSDRSALHRALLREQKPQPITIHINTATADGDKLAVDYSITGNGRVGNADLFAIIVEDVVQSSVSRGENSGRTLTHVSVSRSMTRIGAVSSSDQRTIQLSLPNSVSGSPKRNFHLILFAQAAGLGPVLGATEKSFKE
jgi:hypothetical protein